MAEKSIQFLIDTQHPLDASMSVDDYLPLTIEGCILYIYGLNDDIRGLIISNFMITKREKGEHEAIALVQDGIRAGALPLPLNQKYIYEINFTEASFLER